MKSVASYAFALLCMSQSTQALQMILSTRDPMCITVEPKRANINMDINYSVSGVNEDQVTFTVSNTSSIPVGS